MTEQVVKSKDLRRQTKERMAVFPQNVINIVEEAVSICVIIPQNRKLKEFQLHIIDGIRYGDKLPKKIEKPLREKGGAHFM